MRHHFRSRRNVKFCACRPDSRYQPDQPIDLLACSPVQNVRVWLWPVRDNQLATPLTHCMPKLLGNERHEGMKHDQYLIENPARHGLRLFIRSEEHTSELQSLMRISYAVFFLKKKKNK